MGFDVRKRYTNVSSYDCKVTSCRYVCSNEGHRRKGLTDQVIKYFRAETRTDCKALMSLCGKVGREQVAKCSRAETRTHCKARMSLCIGLRGREL